MYLGAKRRYINTLAFLSFSFFVLVVISRPAESRRLSWLDGDHFSDYTKFPDFSLTLPVGIATLLSMYVAMIISPVQLVVLYMSRKTTTCASIGHSARLFA